MYRTLHPTLAKYIFFTWDILHDRSYVRSQNKLDKFLNIKIIQSIFPNPNGMKLDINSRMKTRKPTNMWKLNKILLNNKWVKKEITWEIRKYPETNEN